MRLLAAVVAIGIVVSAAGASAAGPVTPRWLAPEQASPPQQSASRLPTVAMDDAGNALFVFGGTSGVEALFRAAGGQGGQWARLGQCGGVARAAFDGFGKAIVVWQECPVGGAQRVMTTVRTPGLLGEWQAPVSLSTPGRFAFSETLAVNDRGDAVASWSEGADEFMVIQASVRSGATGAWTEAVQLSSTGAYAYESFTAINTAGDVAVAFTRSDLSGPVAWNAFKPRSASWQPAQKLSEPGNYGVEPRIALDEAGNAIAVWTENSQGTSSFRSKADGQWQPRTPFPGYAPDLAVDAAGNVLAVWAPSCGGVRASRRLAGAEGSWSDTVTVDQDDSCSTTAPDAMFDAAGDALVFWSRSGPGASGSVNMARSPMGGGDWEEPARRRVEGELGLARYAADAGGNGAAVWVEYRSPRAVLFALLDAAVPSLRTLTVPSTGAAGRRVRCSASFSDISETTLRWQFGDGATATGTTARHTYRRPGTYRVRVTATDAAGHRGSMSQPIRITR